MGKPYRPVNSKTLAEINRQNIALNAPVQDQVGQLDAKLDLNKVEYSVWQPHQKIWYYFTTAGGYVGEGKEPIGRQEKPSQDSLIPHPPLIKEMVQAAHVGQDASSSPFEQGKQKLESTGHKATGTHSTGATIYKHPKEKGSVLLTKEGHILANE